MGGPSGTGARIELKLRDINQLFHTLDPSPFRERSLDVDAEAFILSWARDIPPATGLELIVHLNEPAANVDLQPEVESAVQGHFRYLAESKEREFRRLIGRGRTSLLIGLAFLAACAAVGNALNGEDSSTLALPVRESLLIGGWVAMWRPGDLSVRLVGGARSETRL